MARFFCGKRERFASARRTHRYHQANKNIHAAQKKHWCVCADEKESHLTQVVCVHCCNSTVKFASSQMQQQQQQILNQNQTNSVSECCVNASLFFFGASAAR